jgi:hypothetical protein
MPSSTLPGCQEFPASPTASSRGGVGVRGTDRYHHRLSCGDEIGEGNANCVGCGSRWGGQPAPDGSFVANGPTGEPRAMGALGWRSPLSPIHTSFARPTATGSSENSRPSSSVSVLQGPLLRYYLTGISPCSRYFGGIGSDNARDNTPVNEAYFQLLMWLIATFESSRT